MEFQENIYLINLCLIQHIIGDSNFLETTTHIEENEMTKILENLKNYRMKNFKDELLENKIKTGNEVNLAGEKKDEGLNCLRKSYLEPDILKKIDEIHKMKNVSGHLPDIVIEDSMKVFLPDGSNISKIGKSKSSLNIISNKYRNYHSIDLIFYKERKPTSLTQEFKSIISNKNQKTSCNLSNLYRDDYQTNKLNATISTKDAKNYDDSLGITCDAKNIDPKGINIDVSSSIISDTDPVTKLKPHHKYYFGTAIIFCVGLSRDEVVKVRVLLDSVGALNVRIIHCDEKILKLPVVLAFLLPDDKWDENSSVDNS